MENSTDANAPAWLTLIIIVSLENATDTANANAAIIDNARISQVVNILGEPAAVGQLLHVIRCLVIAANDYSHDGCPFLALFWKIKKIRRLLDVKLIQYKISWIRVKLIAF